MDAPPPPYGAEDADYDLTPIPHALNRPRLPQEKRNPHLGGLTDEDTIVKFQTIVREGKEIVVGRIKVPTPGVHSHAFMLRRYDTNAISLSTMYKVAFPGATEEDERREMDWIKSSYDIRNTNGGRGCDAVRLAGQWISRQLAIHLAPAYGLADLVASLSRAIPDPNVAYRKSQRSQVAAEQLARQNAPGEGPAPVPKRQRRQSDEQHLTLEATTTVTAPNDAVVDMEAEIESAKQLVMNLKREIRLKAVAGTLEAGGEGRGVKRGKGEEEITRDTIGGERVIKRSKRVENAMGEAAKKVAWGSLIFGFGIGVATFLPRLAAGYF